MICRLKMIQLMLVELALFQLCYFRIVQYAQLWASFEGAIGEIVAIFHFCVIVIRELLVVDCLYLYSVLLELFKQIIGWNLGVSYLLYHWSEIVNLVVFTRTSNILLLLTALFRLCLLLFLWSLWEICIRSHLNLFIYVFILFITSRSKLIRIICKIMIIRHN